MPSHVHWIASRVKGRLGEFLKNFKSITAKGLLKMIWNNPMESRKEWILQHFRQYGSLNPQKQDYQIWKHDNHPFWLESAWTIDQKTDYLPSVLITLAGGYSQ